MAVVSAAAAAAAAPPTPGRSNTRVADADDPLVRITQLLECVAKTVEGAQPVVETNYGPGHMALVLEPLLRAVDLHGGRFLDIWVSRRRLAALLEGVRVGRNLTAATTEESIPASVPSPLDLDPVLHELQALLQVDQLFSAFVRRHVTADFFSQDDDAAAAAARASRFTATPFHRQLEEMAGQYVALEEFYLRRSLHKVGMGAGGSGG